MSVCIHTNIDICYICCHPHIPGSLKMVFPVSPPLNLNPLKKEYPDEVVIAPNQIHSLNHQG
jgi:hypothetical protein